MILLDATTTSLEVLLGAAHTTNALPCFASYTDTTTTAALWKSELDTNGTTAITLVAAPGASTKRRVRFISIVNLDTVSQTVTIRYNNNGVFRTIRKYTLSPNDSFEYTEGSGFKVSDSVGACKSFNIPGDIADGSVTLAKMADMATDSFLGRDTAGTGVPEVLSAATAKTVLALVKGDVGLGSVDNTSDAAKPVSTAQQTALDLKSPLASPTFAGTPAAPTAGADTNTTQLATTAFVLSQAASQAEQEAGSSVTKMVTAGRQHFHPSAVKCWGRFNTAGGVTASYNITSVTDTGTGVIAVTIGTDFSGAGVYAAQVSVEATATTWAVANTREAHIRSATLAAGTVSLDCIDNTATTSLVKDPSSWHFSAFGDL